MAGIATISQAVPLDNKRVILVGDQDQDTDKIIEALKQQHALDRNDYDKISDYFWKGNARDTARGLFDFHKKHITYAIEPEADQTVRTPGRIMYDRHGDCKHYSLFSCGIVDSLCKKGYPIAAVYRFVADRPNLDVHHVFSVITGRAGECYWCDPVLNRFDERPKFYNVKDYHMSGIGSISRLSGTEVGRHHKHHHHWLNISLQDVFTGGASHVADFLKHHGIDPHRFKGPREMHEGLMRLIRHHKYSPSDIANFMYKNRPGVGYASQYSNQNMPMVIGKHGKGLKKFKHAMNVNFANAKKGVKAFVNANLKIGLIPARKAFLALVALNARSLATNLNNLKKEGNKYQQMLDHWVKKAGGSAKVLDQAIHNGSHRKRLGEIGYIGVAGYDDATITALCALASAILAMLGSFIHKPGPAGAASRAAEAADATKGAANMLAAAVDDVGALVPAGNAGPKITHDVGADGSPEITVHDIDPPQIPGHDHDAAGAGTNPPDDGGADGASPDIDQSTMPAGSNQAPKPSGAGFQGIINKAKDFFFHNETLIIGGVAGVIILKMFVFTGGKKRRR